MQDEEQEEVAAHNEGATSMGSCLTVGGGPTMVESMHNIDLSEAPIEAAHMSQPLQQPVLSKPALHITVSDPVRRVGDHSFIPGVATSHYEYLVTSTSLLSEEAPSNSVRRRFSDFVSLADVLMISHRGFFVFPRPGKNALEGQIGGAEFVEERRRELEHYLRKLAEHPIISTSEELRVFLQAQGGLLASSEWNTLTALAGLGIGTSAGSSTLLLKGVARLPRQLFGGDITVPSAADAARSAKQSPDLLRRLRELGERMRQEYQSPPALPDDELRLREERVMAEEHQLRLAAASKSAERLLQAFEELERCTGDVGLSLKRLAKYEDEDGTKCGGYTDIGSCARNIASEVNKVSNATMRVTRLGINAVGDVVDALQPLHDELGLIPAVIDALREREDALLTVQSLEDDLGGRKREMSQLEEATVQNMSNGDNGRSSRVGKLRDEVEGLEAAVAAARAEYERVKERNLSELRRWRLERGQNLKKVAQGLARIQTLLAERQGQMWSV